jgi:hypothetical protein
VILIPQRNPPLTPPRRGTITFHPYITVTIGKILKLKSHAFFLLTKVAEDVENNKE